MREDTRLDRWVFRIAQTIWLNDLRAAKIRRGKGMMQPEEADLIDPAASAELTLYLAQVLSGVMELPEAQRMVIFLVCVEGYSYKEAAEHMGVPIGTVMSRLAAARARLSAMTEGVPVKNRER
jgi:RNA polymerase sigma-70 factor (ECF subfamily)